MRSATGPILIILGLATTLIVGLLFLQSIGLRSDLEATRSDVLSVMAAQDAAVPAEELRAALDDISARLEELETSAGLGDGTTDPEQPAGGDGEIADRLDEILDRIEALDARVDEVCSNVPVC